MLALLFRAMKRKDWNNLGRRDWYLILGLGLGFLLSGIVVRCLA